MPKKTFAQKLAFRGDLPKTEAITNPRLLQRYGGNKLYIAAPMQYHELMAKVPWGKVVTADQIRAYFARQAGADATCPLTAGIFINICAQASLEPNQERIPYWRTLKAGGELNEKYPDGIDGQRLRLEAEGHRVVQKGTRYFLKDYEGCRWPLEEAHHPKA